MITKVTTCRKLSSISFVFKSVAQRSRQTNWLPMGMTPAPATMPGCIAIGCMPTACIPGIAGCCMGIPAIIGCSHSPATFRSKRKIGRARLSWISEAYLARHGHDPAHRSHPGYHRRLLHSHPHPHVLCTHHSLHRAAEVHARLSRTCRRTSLSQASTCSRTTRPPR